MLSSKKSPVDVVPCAMLHRGLLSRLVHCMILMQSGYESFSSATVSDDASIMYMSNDSRTTKSSRWLAAALRRLSAAELCMR